MRSQSSISPRIRQARIGDLVRKHGMVTVDELAERFSTSHETIRRDLGVLAESGAVQKVHGGAKLPSRREEGPFRERMTVHEPAKRMIAAKLARLIDPGDTILIDTGTTTLICAQELARIDNLTVVTNSTAIAATFAETGKAAGIYLIGGAYEADNRETVGPMAIRQLQGFHGDHGIISAAALDARAGVLDMNVDEAQIAQTMIEEVDNVIIVADASKFNRRASFGVCGFDRVGHLVSDQPPTGQLAVSLAEANVSVP